jgi:hypothetical protein
LKPLANILVIALIASSCRIGTGDQTAQNEPKSSKNQPAALKSIASQFPVSKIDELVEQISQEELADVIADGKSKGWTSTGPSADHQEIVVRSRSTPDNLVRFVLYQGNPIIAMIGIQQQNAQVVTTEVWEYRFNVNEDHPERWNQYLLPEYKLQSFFDERVVLPEEFRNQPAKPYLDYELGLSSITVSLNKWSFLRQLEGDSVSPAGALDPALIKYKYVLNWNGDDFVEERVNEAGYTGMLIFTSGLVETRTDGGPGPHEFDCPQGVSVKASSTLLNQDGGRYNASNMVKRSEAWSEGVEGDGIGEWIEFTITSQYHIGNTWQIANGNNRNKELWNANNRIKKLKVLVDDQLVGYVMLANVFTYQEFDIAPNWLKDPPLFRKGTKIRFIIEEVYKGAKNNNTLISYFVPTGNCG